MAAKILIIRFSSIGDIVLTTPVLRCIKEQFEGDTEIHYLTKKPYAPILEANPRIDQLHTIRKNAGEVTGDLARVGFDYVVDLHRNFRSFFVKRKLKALSFSVNKLNWQKWLLVNLKINKLPDRHIVERYIETLGVFGIKPDGKGLEYYIPEQDQLDLTTLPETHQKGYIAFAIGGTYATKRLPDKKIMDICRKLDRPVVLLGDGSDRNEGQKIKSYAGDKVINACGEYNINQTASLIQQADAVISHDTGTMHIAAAFNKKLVSIWGNTVPEFGMYPYMPETEEKSTIVQVPDLPCRPCSKLGYDECPKKHFYCMKLIDEEEVLEGIK